MRTIALIAHDGKKADMVTFLRNNLTLFKRADIALVATGTTGGHVEQAGLTVQKVLSGPRGGDAQIAARLAVGEIDAVFFFRDPLDKHPHEPDIAMLMRLCDVHNIPLATNPATAELVFAGLLAE
ncbi:MAG: methylglyoxal synthase [Bacteroidetes bacterium]|uniref:Methylglyoxal synthase n=1 Tax=Phaeocystidibacter marisrubri TaxID=1577780 RepID=A0A6L3ZCP1_9FLAO|nr:methylglyoxal synthase [Phaeocystidibacter marisrubri]KAB2815079.1 methylglyoxal synthase [Phaeocystidibacter marisrubri]TNE27673.1 MAG: methylglyoxal synthase [Bacteroidota bacterium]GGH70186.1 methylglyoxal synthase [Phaeocystidibacter marisrubri]